MSWQLDLLEKISLCASFLSKRFGSDIDYAIITGTGLSDIHTHFQELDHCPYRDIPSMPLPSVEGHAGVCRLLTNGSVKVLMFCGRSHYYEGFTMAEITFPVRVIAKMGIPKLILTNAAGSLHKTVSEGSLALISDHIYLLPEHPLRGIKMAEFGSQFPDPKDIYQNDLRAHILAIANEKNAKIEEGVYACLQGPSLETRAELKYLKAIGTDFVGMSTIPEVLVAIQCGLDIQVISVVTNVVDPSEHMNPVELQDVIEVSRRASERLGKLLLGLK